MLVKLVSFTLVKPPEPTAQIVICFLFAQPLVCKLLSVNQATNYAAAAAESNHFYISNNRHTCKQQGESLQPVVIRPPLHYNICTFLSNHLLSWLTRIPGQKKTILIYNLMLYCVCHFFLN